MSDSIKRQENLVCELLDINSQLTVCASSSHLSESHDLQAIRHLLHGVIGRLDDISTEESHQLEQMQEVVS